MEKLGKYEIRSVLGRGAMGTVYEGWDAIISRRVAIKTVRLPDTDDSEERELLTRFQQEAQAAGRLQHPNVVGVFDYAETTELAYIVMEFVAGQTLKAIAERPIRPDLAEVGRLMDGLLKGLEYSHTKGVIHRDIKPANVIVTPKGEVKIADFGIARIESSTMTQAGTIMGTPAYMSPEQFQGIHIDSRTDIYSAGIVLFQLLTGKRPFEGSMATIMHAVLNNPAPRPSNIEPSVPASLDAIVAHAIARSPDDRYPDAAAFNKALQAALLAPGQAPVAPRAGIDQGLGDLLDDDEGTIIQGAGHFVPKAAQPTRAAAKPTTGAPTKEGAPTKAPDSRSKLPLVLAGVGALILLGGGGGFMMLGRDPKPEPARETRIESLAAPSIPGTAPAPSRVAAADPPARLPTPVQPAYTPPPVAEPVPAAPPLTQRPLAAANPATTQPPTPVTAPAQVGPEPARPSTPPPLDEPVATQEPLRPPPQPPYQPPAPSYPPPNAASAPANSAPRPATPPAVPTAATPSTAPTTTPTANPVQRPADPPTNVLAFAQPSPEALRAAITSAISGSSCTFATGEDAGSRGPTLRGATGQKAGGTGLHDMVQDAVPNQSFDWQVASVDARFCPLLDVLKPFARPYGSTVRAVAIALADNRTDLVAGDVLLPRVVMPDGPSYLQLDYVSSDGSVLHMHDSKPAPPYASGASPGFGDSKPGAQRWAVDVPFGTDLVIAISTSSPLFRPAQALPNNLDAYLQDLRTALAQTQRNNSRVSVSVLPIHTRPKS